MYKYEMDPTRTVGATERTPDAGRTDGRTDGVKPIYPPINFIVRGYKYQSKYVEITRALRIPNMFDPLATGSSVTVITTPWIT